MIHGQCWDLKNKYDYQLDLSNENSSHTKAINMIGCERIVLEIGCAKGYITQYLRENLGCRVFAVEIDSEAAGQAKKYCEDIIIGDVERLSSKEIFQGRQFDVIMMTDVLEHLKNPRQLLLCLKNCLSSSGFIVLSIPNGTHGSVGLELLDGKWEYRRQGLLDQTHLRFYDRDSMSLLLTEAGFFISQLDRVIIHPRDTEMKTPWDSYPREVTAYLEKVNPEFQTYQFVVKAFPMSDSGWHIGINDALACEKKRNKQLEAIIAENKKELADLGVKNTALEDEKADIHKGYLKESKKIAERAHQERDQYQTEISNLTAELSNIQQSVGWLMIIKCLRFIDIFLPPQTRRRRFFSLSILAAFILATEGPLAFLKKIKNRFFLTKPQREIGGSTSPEVLSWEPMFFPGFQSILVSIIIPVFNHCQYTIRCLKAVIENTSLPFEVIVVDDASEDETSLFLKDIRGITVITNISNCGFVKACNCGAAAASGDYLLFLNNDTEVTAGWLEVMLRGFDDNLTGIVGAKLVYPDGSLQEAGNIVWRDGTGWNYGRGDNPDLPQYNYLKEVDYCSGACLLISKELWLLLGGFDQRFAPGYYEDTDLCFSVRARGLKVIYQPEARVIHHEGATAGRDTTQGAKQYQQKNLSKFTEKWQVVLERDHSPGPDELYIARERGAKKRVLVADYYIPVYDNDSESMRMFNLLKILKEIGYKVVYFLENTTCDAPYAQTLQRNGIEVLYGNIIFEEYLAKNGCFIDLVILSGPNVAIKFIDHVKALSKARVIYDTVDLHFLRETRHAEIERDPTCKAEAVSLAADWKQKELFLMNRADAVLVVSQAEKNFLENEMMYRGKVWVVSGVHTLEDFYSDYEGRSGIVFISNFVHQPNEDGILWFAERVFPKLQEKIPFLHLTIIGSHFTNRVKSLSSNSITVSGYVSDLRAYFQKAKVFICPLRYETGVKGKIGRSMSYGLPVVTTSIGAEGFGLLDGIDALIADNEDDFCIKVDKLYHDRSLWETLSTNGRDVIEKKFSSAVIRKNLEHACSGDRRG